MSVGCALAAASGCTHRPEPASPGAEDRTGAMTLRFHAWGGYLPFVAVGVAGKPRAFILDTGADGELIDVALARSVGWQVTSTAATPEAGGDVEEGLTRGTLDIGGLALRDWRMITAPIAGMGRYLGQPLDGLLGHSFLRDRIVEIDWLTETIAIHPAGWVLPAAAAFVVPLEITDIDAYVHVGLETASGVVDARLELDTGSFESVGLAGAFVDAHQLAPPGQPRLVLHGVGLGGELDSYRTRIAAVRIGDIRIARPLMAVSHGLTPPAGPTAAVGTLGCELLRRFTVTLDYPHSRMLLRPNRLLDDPIDADMTGMMLVAGDDGSFVVTGVADGSPAAGAGIRKADAIIAIDGRPARNWTLEQLFLRARRDHSELAVEVRRADATVFKATLQLARLL